MKNKELIEQIKAKADSIGTSTAMDRRVKGAYVDCLIMVRNHFDNVGHFNCLEQNIKGDAHRCESHCGKCVN